ncbi:hypothetical protein GYMLUDRAFT_225000, partial [Collybiopsis luxurians FD-317 M1]
MVKMLLDGGSDPNIQGGHYGSALCAAIANGREDIINLLLERDAKVNIPGEMFGAPLHVAGLMHIIDDEKYGAIIKKLLEKEPGTNPQWDTFGGIADIAIIRKDEKLVELCQEKELKR